MKCYIMVWNVTLEGSPQATTERRPILDALDEIPEVITWRASVRSIFIASEQTEDFLAEAIRGKLPRLTFLVSRISIDTSQGWIDRETWKFIREHSK